MPKWLKAVGKFLGTAILKAVGEEIKKKKPARTVAPKTPSKSLE